MNIRKIKCGLLMPIIHPIEAEKNNIPDEERKEIIKRFKSEMSDEEILEPLSNEELRNKYLTLLKNAEHTSVNTEEDITEIPSDIDEITLDTEVTNDAENIETVDDYDKSELS